MTCRRRLIQPFRLHDCNTKRVPGLEAPGIFGFNRRLKPASIKIVPIAAAE